jgi:hypothetical protein
MKANGLSPSIRAFILLNSNYCLRLFSPYPTSIYIRPLTKSQEECPLKKGTIV